MLEGFKESMNLGKPSYLHQRQQQIQEALLDLEGCHQDLQLIFRQRDQMRQNRFSWSSEAEHSQANLNKINGFFQNFYQTFNFEADKQFGLCCFFQQLVPLDFLFLYFRNLNSHFGHFIYDGSLRIKSVLVFCFMEFYLNTDFHFAFRIEFGNGFDFDSKVRN